MGIESETDYNNLNVNSRAKSDSRLLYLDNEPADDNGFGPGIIHISSSLVADHPNDNNMNNGGVINDAQLRLSVDRPGSASPDYKSLTYRANKLRVNTDITQGSVNYINLDVTKELDREYSVSTKERNKDGNDTYFTKKLKLSAVSGDNPAFDSNISELWDN